jgi:hypothetical protein
MKDYVCDVCYTIGAKHYVSIPTGLEDIQILPIRLCAECRRAFQQRSNTLVPVFDTIVRALKLLKDTYQLWPLPSPDDTQASGTGAMTEGGPEV